MSKRPIRYRFAKPTDADAIAALHADSWRRNYRGAWSDACPDGDVFADRRAVWDDRLVVQTTDAITLVAERDGAVVGFAHTVPGDDETWGALIDNLHVTHELKRTGVAGLRTHTRVRS